MHKIATALVIALLVTPAAAQTNDEASTETLYKSSVVIENARIHIATFDSAEKRWRGTVFDYNWANCVTAAKLFQNQPDTRTRFWCEKGRYRE